jgi:hypothetical protein
VKQFGVVDQRTNIQVAGPFDQMGVAHRVCKALGEGYATVTWIGFIGLPAVACVFRDDGQLETLCLYSTEADRIAKQKNEQEPGTFKVLPVMLNGAYYAG